MVLITGESGTGKEIFARHIHQLMHRDDSAAFAPFLGVNCAALPEQLIESELFGHEKGAFTDAKAEKKGIFEQADGGSILLDEIGEMRLDLQAKLLRVLEERKVRRIGGRQDIPMDTMVFATTNRDLEEAVKKGEFRVDLYLPAERFSPPSSAAAGAQRRHPVTCPPLPQGLFGEVQEDRAEGLLPGGGGAAGRLPLAGEHPGTAQRHRADRRPRKRRDRPAGASARGDPAPQGESRGEAVSRADDPRHGAVPGGGGEEPDRPGAREGRAATRRWRRSSWGLPTTPCGTR